MSYARFALMILTSTAMMFVLMYANTYAWEHVFFSETRVYMAILMGAAMAFVMLAFMAGMYSSRTVNFAIFVASIAVFGASLWLVRSQTTVDGKARRLPAKDKEDRKGEGNADADRRYRQGVRKTVDETSSEERQLRRGSS
jgi:hypothetical protein